jgi:pimeloyl-ACP methyl ester carboxylesterase
MWEPQWPIAGHRAVRCDFRGYGSSPAATVPYRDADDVIELLDHLAIDRTALVGSSHGGSVALEIAARWPDRVSALLLLCPALPGHEFSAAVRAFGAQEDDLLDAGDIDGAVELNLRMWLGPSATDAARDQFRQMQRHAFEVQLAAPPVAPLPVEFDLSTITARCLAVSGAHDVSDFREIAATFPNHVELPWAGHLPSMERPAAIAALIEDFL